MVVRRENDNRRPRDEREDHSMETVGNSDLVFCKFINLVNDHFHKVFVRRFWVKVCFSRVSNRNWYPALIVFNKPRQFGR